MKKKFEINEPDIKKEEILFLPDKDFHVGNVCVVTGASGGIGRATAVAAANNLMTVGLDIDEKEGRHTTRLARRFGGQMTSIHAHICTLNKPAYNIMKFWLRALTQSIAAEGQGKIRAFSVSAGFVKTALTPMRATPATQSWKISYQQKRSRAPSDVDLQTCMKIFLFFLTGFWLIRH